MKEWMLEEIREKNIISQCFNHINFNSNQCGGTCLCVLESSGVDYCRLSYIHDFFLLITCFNHIFMSGTSKTVSEDKTENI